MIHEIHRVVGMEHIADFTLRLEFSDGTTQTIDFSPILVGELYGLVADPSFFRQVKLDREIDTIVWPNGADFDPADLHDWPSVREDFIRLAQSWLAAPAKSQATADASRCVTSTTGR
jgi:hypothetical protein